MCSSDSNRYSKLIAVCTCNTCFSGLSVTIISLILGVGKGEMDPDGFVSRKASWCYCACPQQYPDIYSLIPCMFLGTRCKKLNLELRIFFPNQILCLTWKAFAFNNTLSLIYYHVSVLMHKTLSLEYLYLTWLP